MRRFLGLALLCWPLLIGPASSATKDLSRGFADHGVATPSGMPRGIVATVDGRQHPIVLTWLMDHRECYELLWVDVLTGKAEEFPLPVLPHDSPFASLLSASNKFYTHMGSYFLEFDPCRRAFTFCRKTVPQMAMSMTEDDQGVIWSATYPQCGIVSFNPQSRELRDYGHVYKQDWSMYLCAGGRRYRLGLHRAGLHRHPNPGPRREDRHRHAAVGRTRAPTRGHRSVLRR